MKIHLHIDRLVLDGIPAGQPQVLQRTFEAELARKLGEDGLARQLHGPATVPRISGGNVRIAGKADSAQLGRQIAGAVHHGIGAKR
jgi:hypothetical protein